MNISQRLRTCAKHTGLDAVIELLTEAADEIDALQARAQVQGEPVTVAVDHFDNGPFEACTNRIHPPVEIGTKLYTTTQPAQATQAEAQQPAAGEPVACATPDGLKSNWHAHHVIVNKAALQMVRNALRNDVERGLKVRGEMLAELDSATFQAHPAPSVPDDVVLKAMRYEWLRYSDLDDAAARFWPEGDVPEGDAFDAAINAAMLAASNA